jgi:carbon starvation protein
MWRIAVHGGGFAVNGLTMLALGVVAFVAAYFIYGRFLSRLFGVDDNRKTPAHEHEDGIDYIPTKPAVLFGHHFASIAGAGPIVGPIAAAYFGWMPVLAWIIIGCIFVGAVHDFAALFLSVRNEGRSIGHIIETQIGYAGRQMFLLFAWAALLLVVAIFAMFVAKTFTASPSVATSSLLFILMAPVFGWLTHKKGVALVKASLVFVPLLFVFVWVGVKLPLDLVQITGWEAGQIQKVWTVVLLGYAFIASVLPVWMLLQPRDYLNSYLLYSMLLLGFVGIAVAMPEIKTSPFEGWSVMKGTSEMPLFPILFVTVACGACSGFHSLVASGTSSKQLSREAHILPIGYGGMLVEGVLAIMALISVGYLSYEGMIGRIGELGPVGAFSAGLAEFCEKLGIGKETGATFFSLAISAFLLTTLDTATRLTRFTWEELFMPGDKHPLVRGKVSRFFANRFLATLIVVVLAGALAFTGASGQIWPVFGASNQLLAALTLLVITLILIKKKSKFLITMIPMIFMMVVCLWALVSLLITNLIAGNKVLVIATAFLVVMAVILMVQSAASVIKARAKKDKVE